MTQEQIKHLDYLQSNISRFASNQFQIKGWSITLSTAILTIFANSFSRADGPNGYFLLIAVFPTLIFWIMDARFLSMERRLRRIYRDVIQGSETIQPLDFPVMEYKGKEFQTLRCMFSFSNCLVYLFSCACFLIGFLAFLYF